MKKIALALIALVAVLSPLAAGESWIGVTTGPSFDIQKQGDADAFTDFGWDVNVEGTYYFNEAETIGLGVKLGVGFNYDSTYSVSLADTIISAVAAAGASSDSSQASQIVNGANLPSIKNPSAGIKLAPAITFQYRLALTENSTSTHSVRESMRSFLLHLDLVTKSQQNSILMLLKSSQMQMSPIPSVTSRSSAVLTSDLQS